MHAWYSAKQFKVLKDCDNIKNPYLYYKTEQGKIIEVTMISNTMEHNCRFDDMDYLGKVESFYKRTKEPLDLP